MTCREVNQFLNEYLDRTLPWHQRLWFNLHLLVCRHCRRYLRSYATTIRVTQTLGQPTESALTPVPDDLVRAILAARRSGIEPQTDGELPQASP